MNPLHSTDDLSLLLLHSKKLRDVRLHWSPRILEEAEPSINLRLYFGKCIEARYHMPLNTLVLHNFFGVNIGDLKHICDPEKVRTIGILNCAGGNLCGPTTSDDGLWKGILEEKCFKNVRSVRCSEVSEQHVAFLSSVVGLEELYLIGDKTSANTSLNEHLDGHMESPNDEIGSPRSTSTCHSSLARPAEQIDAALCKQYLRALFTCHGQTIKRLLLHDTWAISGDQLSELVSFCPNLDQLGLGISEEEPQALRFLGPCLKKLRCVRLLDNPGLQKAMRNEPVMVEMLLPEASEPLLWKVSHTSRLEWVGFGDSVFRIGKAVQLSDANGRTEWRREVWRARADHVKHIDIWRWDCMEI